MSVARHGATLAGRVADADGELTLRPEEFRRIAEMLHVDAGIYLPENKSMLVYSRLAKRLRVLGLGSFRDYCDLVASQAGRDERHEMLVALTTNVTSFFREPHHFDYLKTLVLPPLLRAAKDGARVRIWSAGCSRGHEPYSIAMTVLSMMPDAADRDVRILASDIDTTVLEEARAGAYDEKTVAEVPHAERMRYFKVDKAAGDRPFSVHPDLKRLIAFRELNLIGRWPMKGTFDVIFCRNVVIYFDEATQRDVWRRFADALAPGGFLFLGHSERLSPEVHSRFGNAGLTTYRLIGGARA